jgi:hypothetical protein
MTEYDDLFAEVGVPMLQQQFGEWLVYLPKNGKPRPFWALHVQREPPQQLGELEGTVSPKVIVDAPNDVVSGVSSREINTGGDEVVVAMRKGAVDKVFGPIPRRIIGLVSDCNGVTRFEVQ